MLRELKSKDAPLMLEWMHDETVVKNMQSDFLSKNIEDCLKFINDSNNDNNNCHLAIVNEKDEYLGTVSLKHITGGCAEFAITIRAVAMGKGVSKLAMSEIINVGFNKYNLKCIYWCVSLENARAVRFYDKNGYRRCLPNDIGAKLEYSDEQVNQYLWYTVVKDDYSQVLQNR